MTYDNECTACGHAWETSQGMTEEPVKVCPACGKDTAHRVILQAPRFRLVGWGWSASGYDKTVTGKK